MNSLTTLENFYSNDEQHRISSSTKASNDLGRLSFVASNSHDARTATFTVAQSFENSFCLFKEIPHLWTVSFIGSTIAWRYGENRVQRGCFVRMAFRCLDGLDHLKSIAFLNLAHYILGITKNCVQLGFSFKEDRGRYLLIEQSAFSST